MPQLMPLSWVLFLFFTMFIFMLLSSIFISKSKDDYGVLNNYKIYKINWEW